MSRPNQSPGSHHPPLSYAIVSVIRDEEAFIPRTIRSVVAQTVRPKAWIIVDDGSRDGTLDILDSEAASTSWITVIRSPRREGRNPSQATAEGFNRALPQALDLQVDAVVKLDGDMEFGPDYFQKLLEAMAQDPRLGIVGGRALEPHADGTWGRVRISRHHVHGATQLYRREVLLEQGGLVVGIGEDTVTIIRARLKGWTTRSLNDVSFYHLRVSGSAGGRLRAQRAKGEAAYRVGYHPVFALARALRNMIRKPYLLSGFAFLQGFMGGYAHRAPRALAPDEVRAFRREQFRAMTGRQSWWS